MTEKRPCWHCKTNPPGEPEIVSFEHEGLKVTVFKNGLECVSCVKQSWQDDFEKYGRRLISVQDGSPVVNWRLYVEESERRRSREMEFEMDNILLSVGVLSSDQKGWEIVASGSIRLGPRFARFKRFGDATEFARLKYADTRYSWEINHISESISKEEILR